MSLSPELFVERRGDHVRARPMKGTTRRGRWLDEDERLSQALVDSEKARAENVMIVDLLRNDIGRVAETGSVRVSELCALERYPTVWQLTSRIDATLRPATSLWDLLRAVFPCGSVTGRPRCGRWRSSRTLESSPRGMYTGAVCLLQPGGDLIGERADPHRDPRPRHGHGHLQRRRRDHRGLDCSRGMGRMPREGPRRPSRGRARRRIAVRDDAPRGGDASFDVTGTWRDCWRRQRCSGGRQTRTGSLQHWTP